MGGAWTQLYNPSEQKTDLHSDLRWQTRDGAMSYYEVRLVQSQVCVWVAVRSPEPFSSLFTCVSAAYPLQWLRHQWHRFGFWFRWGWGGFGRTLRGGARDDHWAPADLPAGGLLHHLHLGHHWQRACCRGAGLPTQVRGRTDGRSVDRCCLTAWRGVLKMIPFVHIFISRSKCSLTDRYRLHLSAADLLFVLALPFWAVDAALADWRFEEVACIGVHVIYTVNLYGSVLILAFISLDRYLAVVRATDTNTGGLRQLLAHRLVYVGECERRSHLIPPSSLLPCFLLDVFHSLPSQVPGCLQACWRCLTWYLPGSRKEEKGPLCASASTRSTALLSGSQSSTCSSW